MEFKRGWDVGDSSQTPPTIDHQHLAGDEARVGVAEEADGVGDIVDAANAANGDAGKHGFTELGLL
jgi:hypothetical protein